MYYPFKYPKHIVIETDNAVYIDGKRIRFIVKDSIKTEPFGSYAVITLSFVAKKFLKR